MKLYLSEGITAYRKRTLILSADLYGRYIPGLGKFGDIQAGNGKVANPFLQGTLLHIN